MFLLDLLIAASTLKILVDNKLTNAVNLATFDLYELN